MTPEATRPLLQPMFIDGCRGRLFAVLFSSVRPGAAGRRILLIPPFAEEMNRSRRMYALQAQAFARAGADALLLDPFATGDSDGDFAEACWDAWLDDVDTGVDWLRARGSGPIWILGLRLGALLACNAAMNRSDVSGLVLWHPVLSGEAAITQFLRVQLAASLSGGERQDTATLQKRISAGETIEIAGYPLSPGLARSLADRQLANCSPHPGTKVIWIEVAGERAVNLSLQGQRITEGWTQRGVPVETRVAEGEKFWLMQETTIAPSLISTTLAALEGDRGGC